MVTVVVDPSGLVVVTGSKVPGVSAGVLLCDGPVEIVGSQAVRKSYPGFFEDYKSLGGRVLTE